MSTSRRWLIGRAPDCDLVVNLPEVSTHHCRLSRTDKGFVLEDLGSSNGTHVNGVRISKPTVVQSTDLITLGQKTPLPWPEIGSSPRKSGLPEGVLRIGRAPENDVVLNYPTISAHHARIIKSNEGIFLEDLGSSNGTAIGHPSHKIKQAPLEPGDVVFFGSFRVPADRLLSAHPRDTAAPPAAAVVFHGDQLVFGRSPDCDQVLNYPMISSRHARLFRAGPKLLIEDLGSSNGTFVNGERIRRPTPVRPGDVIGLGSYTFTLTGGSTLERRDYRGDVTLEASGIGVAVPGKSLIEDVSLTMFPSEFVGLMGPSGAGKTTLMNALNGYTQPSEGEVLINGISLYENFDQFRLTLGYVPQDDILHPQLTVGQALYYSARLRLPSDYSREDLEGRISQVLHQLGMTGTENIRIGSPEKKGISGGERKRVNLAMELLTDPLVLFLDEPTSGLSSEDALTVMRLLRQLADQGKTILLTIHQPSLEAFRQMDNLIVVSRDSGSPEPGRLAYYGPAYPDAIDFFNPNGVPNLRPDAEPMPDEVLRGLAQGSSSEWVSRYQRSAFHRDYVASRAGRQASSSKPHSARASRGATNRLQFLTLFLRALAIKRSDRFNTVGLLAQAPVVGFLIILVFGKSMNETVTDKNWLEVMGSTSPTLFLMTLAALWFGCSNAVREIVGEWAVYRRERMVNLKLLPYVASKFVLLGGLCVFQCGLLLFIVHWGCNLQGSWLPMFGILLLAAWIGVGIGLTLSALAQTTEVAITLLPIVLLALVTLGGAMQTLPKMWRLTQALCSVMPSRWSFEGMVLLESSQRPHYKPPVLPVGPGEKQEEPEEIDMAELFFPKKDDHRTSVARCTQILATMLVLLAGGIIAILRVRDIH